jgi:osmoprotectant transport system ATP-binding protein
VARALAGDPPVMLMDEPFGAIDPITRIRLQNELLKILRSIKKTVIFVTHDVDEAIKMGDRVAILRDGRLVQYAPPREILARPADAFVEEFVGRDRVLKRLSLVTAREIMTPGRGAADAPSVPIDAPATEALSAMLAAGRDVVAVIDDTGASRGLVTIDAIRTVLAASPR